MRISDWSSDVCSSDLLTVDLETTEVVGQLTDGSTYKYWTFNNKVPGPFIRIRVGDTVKVNLSNAKEASHIHSVDFHAVTGPGGGEAVTQVAPGQTKSFTFKALQPGNRKRVLSGKRGAKR